MELTFRAILDDGSSVEWYQPFTLPDGTVKPASIDDLDRAVLSNLLTVNERQEIVHAIGFGSHERSTKKAVWRMIRKINSGDEAGKPVTVGVLSGYNELLPDGSTCLVLSFIDAEDGSVSNGSSYECALHPREVFSEALATAITEEQERQDELTAEDNYLLANPILEEEPVVVEDEEDITTD